MNAKFEKLNLFFDRIKTIGFWQRIFGWRQIRSLSYDAYKEFKELENSLDLAVKEADQANNLNTVLNNDNEHLKSEKAKLGTELSVLNEKASRITNDVAQLRHENTIFRQTEADRKTKYEHDVAGLNAVREQIQKDRQEEQENQRKKENEKFESLKKTWARHQESVKERIKMICDTHTIEYVEKVPFRGTPDNTIRLCDEFVIFDAKSPSSDDLQNFPTYIKIQTESVKKYIKEDSVRKDIFLVIPSNTVDVIEKFSYNMADYQVYIVTLDVLEPLILTLKKIEDYEFVNQLSPEERENICRIIGKFAHLTKRRVQVDQYFAREFIAALTKCEADLPKEIFDKVVDLERAEKSNPPQERRDKQILIKDLELDSEKIQKEAEAKGITFPPSIQRNLKGLPLYEDEK